MKRSVTVVFVLSTIFLIGRFWSSLPITAQGIEGEPVATCNGDVNGDTTRNLTDVIYILNWLFQGGPEPVALACEEKDSDFGKLLAGGWVFEINGSFPSVHVLSADGGIVAVGRQQIDGLWDFRPPYYGSWEQTGLHSFVFSLLHYNLDDVGTVVSVTRVDATAELSETADEIGGTFVFKVYPPEADPLDANAPTRFESPGSLLARRIVPRGSTP